MCIRDRSKLVCGFETPDEGTLLLEGRDIGGDSIRERAAHIGYVMQNPNQMISKTMIYDEVALGLAALGPVSYTHLSDITRWG